MSTRIHFAFTLQEQDLDLRADLEADLMGVFGPSGAGKTSLLHLLAGIRKADRGYLSVNGEVLCDTDRKIWTPARARGVAVVFQEGRLFPHLTVAGNLRFGHDRCPKAHRRFQVDEIANLLELGPLLARRPWQLSGGERQRVALGRAILSSPKLLLLDEPMASLDRALKNQILPFLRRIRDEIALPMIHISHDLGELLQLTRHLMVISRGRVLAHGTFPEIIGETEALIHDPSLINVFRADLVANEPEEGIAELSVMGHRWIGPDRHPSAPTRLHIAIRPRDIAIGLEPVPGVSIRNQHEGTVRRLIVSGHKALCRVDLGERCPLLVEITPHTIRELGLREGQRITCLFKARALDYLD